MNALDYLVHSDRPQLYGPWYLRGPRALADELNEVTIRWAP